MTRWLDDSGEERLADRECQSTQIRRFAETVRNCWCSEGSVPGLTAQNHPSAHSQSPPLILPYTRYRRPGVRLLQIEVWRGRRRDSGESGDAVIVRFRNQMESSEASAGSSLRNRTVHHLGLGKARSPIEPLTVPAASITKPSSVARIREILKRRMFGCCLEDPRPWPSRRI